MTDAHIVTWIWPREMNNMCGYDVDDDDGYGWMDGCKFSRVLPKAFFFLYRVSGQR